MPRVAGGTGRGSRQAAGLDWSLGWLCPWAADSTMCARAAGTALSKMTRGKWAHTTTFVPRLKIAFMFLSIILKFQVLDINILLEIRKKAKVFDGPWSVNLVLGPRLM